MHFPGSSRVRAAAVTLALSTALLSSSVASAQEPVVNMELITFAPKEITIPAGTTLQWPNTSILGHTVTSDDGLFDSGMVAPGDSFAFTFDAPGVYQYFCIPHGAAGLVGMSGVITVVDPAAMGEAAPAPAPAVGPAGPAPAPAPPTEEHEYVADH